MSLFNYLIKSDFVKAQILAAARHAITIAGTGLVANGYASDSIVQAASGLVCMVLSFYLSQRDVKGVDEKIKVALATPAPNQVLTTRSTSGLTPEQEAEETALLNKLQSIRPGIPK